MNETVATECGQRRGSRHALIGLNLALLCVLGIMALGVNAQGQPGQPGARARGKYTMVAGQIRTGNASAVWILDEPNQELAVVKWSDPRAQLEGIGFRDLARDHASQPGR
ncbi:MAG: hypothetical protein H6811_03240 [Phycisphaeraceae bacterium]|nr:hypothetical protein [Phycisphaeraceae bacterium]